MDDEVVLTCGPGNEHEIPISRQTACTFTVLENALKDTDSNRIPVGVSPVDLEAIVGIADQAELNAACAARVAAAKLSQATVTDYEPPVPATLNEGLEMLEIDPKTRRPTPLGLTRALRLIKAVNMLDNEIVLLRLVEWFSAHGQCMTPKEWETALGIPTS